MNNPLQSPDGARENQRLWHPLYQQFAREDIEACQIPQARMASAPHVGIADGMPSARVQPRRYSK